MPIISFERDIPQASQLFFGINFIVAGYPPVFGHTEADIAARLISQAFNGTTRISPHGRTGRVRENNLAVCG
jgi:hypothetical protein